MELQAVRNAQVSVVVTVLNEGEQVLRLLESITNQSLKPNEVIIVDGGSKDSTPLLVKDFAASTADNGIVLMNDGIERNIAEGRNAGIRSSSCGIVAVTDSGCVPCREWLERVTAPLRTNDTADVVAGVYDAVAGNDFQRRLAKIWIPDWDRVEGRTFLPSSRSVAFRKKCWEEVGGYPEASLTGEDTLFDMRLKKHGCRFVYEPSASVIWDLPKSYRELWRKCVGYGRGNGELGLYTGRHFVRFLLVIIPFVWPIIRKGEFTLRYLINLGYSVGWLKGVWVRISRAVSARAHA